MQDTKHLGPSGEFRVYLVQNSEKLEPSVTGIPYLSVVSAAIPVISEKAS